MGISSSSFSNYLELFKKSMNITDTSQISIYKYYNEFQEFLKKGDVDTANLSVSLSDIIEQGFFDSLANSENNELNTGDSAKNFIGSLLRNLFNDSDLKGKLDSNGNEILDKEEFDIFMNSLDNNKDSNITIDEIFEAIEKIKEGKIDLTNPADTDKAETLPPAGGNSDISGENSPGTNNVRNNPKNTNNKENNVNNNPNVNNIDNKDANSKSLDNMTASELSAEKAARNNTLQEKENNLREVYAGNTEGIKTAQNNYEKAEENYNTEIENNTKIEESLKEARTKNQEDISKKEDEIKNINTNITDNESKIFELGQSISALDSKISAFEASERNLGTSDDEEEQKKIDSMKQSISEQKQAADAERKRLQEEKTSLEETVNNLKNTDLKTAEKELSDLKTERETIESQINEQGGDEVQELYTKLTTERDNLSKVKNTELTSAKNSVEEAKKAVTEVNDKIKETETTQIKKDYSLKESLADNPFGKVDKYNANWIEGETSAPFMLITPEGIEDYTDVPVIVCYPGSGGICAGKDVQLNNKNSLTNSILEQAGENAPKAIFLVMQTNHTNNWTNGKENVVQYTREALQYVKNHYDIDENNISATGHSLGGDGVRYVAQQDTTLFTSKRIAPISPASIGGVDNKFLSENYDVRLYSGWQSSDGCYNNAIRLANKFFGGNSFIASGGAHVNSTKAAMGNSNSNNWKNDINNNNISDFFEHLLLGKNAK